MKPSSFLFQRAFSAGSMLGRASTFRCGGSALTYGMGLRMASTIPSVSLLQSSFSLSQSSPFIQNKKLQIRSLSFTPKAYSTGGKPTLEINAEEMARQFKRPTSPHLTIYQPQLTSILSGLHRITGAGVGVLFYGGALAYAYGFGSGAGALAIIAGMPWIVLTLGKLILATPVVYHSLNGVRHLLWDAGYMLTLKNVYVGGYAVIAGTILGALWMALCV